MYILLGEIRICNCMKLLNNFNDYSSDGGYLATRVFHSSFVFTVFINDIFVSNDWVVEQLLRKTIINRGFYLFCSTKLFNKHVFSDVSSCLEKRSMNR